MSELYISGITQTDFILYAASGFGGGTGLFGYAHIQPCDVIV